MAGISEILSAFSAVKEWIDEQSAEASEYDLLRVRYALKELYFSHETLEKLQEICEDSQEQVDAADHAGRLAIWLRDSKETVRTSLGELRRFRSRRDVSIEGARLLRLIDAGKVNIRFDVESAVWELHRSNQYKKIEQLLSDIKDLNSAIEELDRKVGGLIFDERLTKK